MIAGQLVPAQHSSAPLDAAAASQRHTHACNQGCCCRRIGREEKKRGRCSKTAVEKISLALKFFLGARRRRRRKKGGQKKKHRAIPIQNSIGLLRDRVAAFFLLTWKRAAHCSDSTTCQDAQRTDVERVDVEREPTLRKCTRCCCCCCRVLLRYCMDRIELLEVN